MNHALIIILLGRCLTVKKYYFKMVQNGAREVEMFALGKAI